jgi:predicted metal-dependent hydrolase
MHHYKDITFSLSKSNRRTASIFIERDGSVGLIVPNTIEKEQVFEIVEKKRSWIYKKLAEWQDLNSSRIIREFRNGESFFYLGSSYRLKMVINQKAPLILKNGYFCLKKTERYKAEEHFKNFYRDKGKQKLTERVGLFSKKMGVAPNKVRVLELKNRWASCSDKGNLNFHWKCMMAPLSVTDYIIVHELAHLIHAKHTEAFWNEIDKVIPDYQDKLNWLRQFGASLSL